MKRKIFSLFILMAMCFSMFHTAYAASFNDLPESHWAYQNISKLVDEGIINGYPDGTYRPDGTVTVGECLKLIMTATYISPYYFKGTGLDFIHWAYPYYREALKEGYVGEIELSELDRPITRFEMISILINICIKNDLAGDLNADVNYQFTDISDLDVPSQSYIIVAAVNQFITGYPDGTFRPDNTVTRAECATIITRFLKVFE